VQWLLPSRPGAAPHKPKAAAAASPFGAVAQEPWSATVQAERASGSSFEPSATTEPTWSAMPILPVLPCGTVQDPFAAVQEPPPGQRLGEAPREPAAAAQDLAATVEDTAAAPQRQQPQQRGVRRGAAAQGSKTGHAP
jgi:hypothetical protein